MKTIIQLISYIGIAALIIPPILFLGGWMEQLESVKTIMLGATIIWFVASVILVWSLDKKSIGK